MNFLKKRKHKNAYICIGVLLLLILGTFGCGKNVGYSEPDPQNPPLSEVMDRILENQKLDEAIMYESGAEDGLKDAIVLLCKSESGKYEAYGFISAEYGKCGILINNIVDGGSNWNYFEEGWAYGDDRPTLEEKGEYGVLFTFRQEVNGAYETNSMYFDTYDTGTMSIKG